MESKLVLVLVLGIVGVFADVAEFESCGDEFESQCTVESVGITPCKDPKNCVLQKGTNTSIAFDYTPKFSASKVKNQVFWVSPAGDTPLADMQTDGCLFTTCPVETGTKQRFNYQLYLGKKFPKGHYSIKWKLWNEKDEAQSCCFITKIQLVNAKNKKKQ